MLEEILRQQISDQGPLRLDTFIDQALYHEQFGYYRCRIPLGKDFDFITAPELSPLFGQMIGLFLLDYWQRASCPTPLRLVELGPGQGTLMADILQSFRLRPTIFNQLTVHMVEISESLKSCQQQKLAQYPFISWHRCIQDVPEGFQLIIGNEFFDAFTIRQFYYNNEWAERFVTVQEGNFCIQDYPIATPPVDFTPEGPCVVETSPLSLDYADLIADKLKPHGGLGLFIDYGAEKKPWIGDSLQAVKEHQFVDVLSTIGTADITHHVDFLSLKQQFRRNGLQIFPLLTQQNFLQTLGIETRLQQLAKKLTSSQLTKLQLAIFRLINPQAMGQLFKVLATTFPSPNHQPIIPAGF